MLEVENASMTVCDDECDDVHEGDEKEIALR